QEDAGELVHRSVVSSNCLEKGIRLQKKLVSIRTYFKPGDMKRLGEIWFAPAIPNLSETSRTSL
ncbi:MAG: hypothetical protein J7456_05685, partial [Chloroflexus sp.]|nr:hypothetical protein [Chloroflexus sp.]MBO9315260.1 hypothetical protein [Chloroflexus sp.]